MAARSACKTAMGERPGAFIAEPDFSRAFSYLIGKYLIIRPLQLMYSIVLG